MVVDKPSKNSTTKYLREDDAIFPHTHTLREAFFPFLPPPSIYLYPLVLSACSLFLFARCMTSLGHVWCGAEASGASYYGLCLGPEYATTPNHTRHALGLEPSYDSSGPVLACLDMVNWASLGSRTKHAGTRGNQIK